jgi:hypothetical protein
MITSELLQRLRHDITTEYQRLQHSLGWRLFYSDPLATPRASVLIIGFNPGGSRCRPDHGELTTPGLAYRTEAWDHPSGGVYAPGNHPLQRQVLALLDLLQIGDERVVAGDLVPFRSRRQPELRAPVESVAIGVSIWKHILDAWTPNLILAIGRDTADSLRDLLGAGRPTIKMVPGLRNSNNKCRIWSFDGSRLIGLPHLSTNPLRMCPELRDAIESV